MNALLYIVFIFLIFIFQTTILHGFTLFNARPDITLILTFLIAVKTSESNGAAAGFMLGLIQDCLTSSLPGTNALSKGIIGFILSNLKDKIIVENAFSQAIFIFLAGLIDAGIFVLIFLLTNSDKTSVNIIFNKLMIASVYTAITGPFIIQIMFFMKKRTGFLGKVANRKYY